MNQKYFGGKKFDFFGDSNFFPNELFFLDPLEPKVLDTKHLEPRIKNSGFFIFNSDCLCSLTVVAWIAPSSSQLVEFNYTKI